MSVPCRVWANAPLIRLLILSACFIIIVIIVSFFYPGTSFRGMKKTVLCTEKSKLAGMVITPSPSENYHVVEWC